jgi:hypothetical protein
LAGPSLKASLSLRAAGGALEKSRLRDATAQSINSPIFLIGFYKAFSGVDGTYSTGET